MKMHLSDNVKQNKPVISAVSLMDGRQKELIKEVSCETKKRKKLFGPSLHLMITEST